ncbi:hypothetical protein L7F22_049382 [Adiantum nelumboides]|nr:hypothetical protein [Adiantum nelumboides]
MLLVTIVASLANADQKGYDKYDGKDKYDSKDKYYGKDKYDDKDKYDGKGKYNGKDKYDGKGKYDGKDKYYNGKDKSITSCLGMSSCAFGKHGSPTLDHKFLPALISIAASVDDPWLQKLPDKKKPLYSHSLPGIEAWLRSLGFAQSNDDRGVWTIQCSDWCTRLSLDLKDLFIGYLKSGPGNLDRDVEQKFSYALSKEDLENAILGGPSPSIVHFCVQSPITIDSVFTINTAISFFNIQF